MGILQAHMGARCIVVYTSEKSVMCHDYTVAYKCNMLCIMPLMLCPSLPASSGGTDYVIRGTGLNVVQEPRLLMYVVDEGGRARRQADTPSYDAISEVHVCTCTATCTCRSLFVDFVYSRLHLKQGFI